MNDIDALEPTPAQFSSLQADEANGPDLNLDVILDVPVTLSLEVGRAREGRSPLSGGRQWRG